MLIRPRARKVFARLALTIRPQMTDVESMAARDCGKPLFISSASCGLSDDDFARAVTEGGKNHDSSIAQYMQRNMTDPSPGEIRRRTEAIRKTWSESELSRRCELQTDCLDAPTVGQLRFSGSSGSRKRRGVLSRGGQCPAVRLRQAAGRSGPRRQKAGASTAPAAVVADAARCARRATVQAAAELPAREARDHGNARRGPVPCARHAHARLLACDSRPCWAGCMVGFFWDR